MSTAEVEAALGCKRARLFELLAAGILERAPRYGRELRIFRSSVERALLNPPKPGRRKKRAPSPIEPPKWNLEDVAI